VVEAAIVVDGGYHSGHHGYPQRQPAEKRRALQVLVAEDEQQDGDHLRHHLELPER
jgi:hypothetical protein